MPDETRFERVPVPMRKIIVYINDVLVLGNTFKGHLYFVRRVLRVFVDYRVKVRG